jgi:hypothetical protein
MMMNENLKNKYIYFNDIIYIIVEQSPKGINIKARKLQLNNKIIINETSYKLIYSKYAEIEYPTTIKRKDFKNAVIFDTLNKCILVENNKKRLFDILDLSPKITGYCLICDTDDTQLIKNVYDCVHNFCLCCSKNWNNDNLNNCPLCRAPNNILYNE